MYTYQIIGISSLKQAERIKERFSKLRRNNFHVEMNVKESTIHLSEEIDPYHIYLIRSFEQVTILPLDEYHQLKQDDMHDGHYHEHDFGSGEKIERKMFIVFSLNFIFSIVEMIFETIFNSQAILSDAIHDFGDALSIGLAFFFEKISKKGANEEFSYGYRRFSLLGAFVTSLFLIVGSGLMIFHTIPELLYPTPINQTGVFWLDTRSSDEYYFELYGMVYFRSHFIFRHCFMDFNGYNSKIYSDE